MLVHRKKKARYAVQLPLTPLIDIVFLLLIYFLLTTNFIVEENMDLILPKASNTNSVKNQTITVSVYSDGHIHLGGAEVSLDDLSADLKVLLAKSTDSCVTVKVDRTVMFDRVIGVIDAVKAAGTKRISIATEKSA